MVLMEKIEIIEIKIKVKKNIDRPSKHENVEESIFVKQIGEFKFKKLCL